MQKPLPNYGLSKTSSSLSSEVNRWMITQYANSFPKREFIHERLILSDYTRAKTRYYNLIRIFCLLLNCRVVRDEASGMIYIIGRKDPVEAFRYYLKQIMHGVENKVNWFKPETLVWGKHKSSQKADYRGELIKKFEEEVETILSLKKEFYLNKYAAMRQVRDNETLDLTFFAEYIRQNRLTHLKALKCSIIN